MKSTYNVDTNEYNLVDSTLKATLKKVSNAFHKHKHLGPKKQAIDKISLPYAYTLPKDKDLRNKTRPIVSYAKHPAKQILNVAGRAFQWLLEHLHTKGEMKSFALFKTQDFAKQKEVEVTHTQKCSWEM